MSTELGTQRQPERTTGQVDQAAGGLEVDHVQAGGGVGVDGGRDVVIQRLRIGTGLRAETPPTHGAVGVGQRGAHVAVAQEALALVHQLRGRVQVGGVHIPFAPASFDTQQEAGELVGVVGEARADIECRIAQACIHAEGIVGMVRTQHRGTGAAAGIHRPARITPRTGDAIGRVVERVLLLGVAELAVQLEVVGQHEGAACKQIPEFLAGAQAAEILRLPQAAAADIGRADTGKLFAAGQRLIKTGGRVTDVADRRIATDGAIGGDGAVEREELAASNALIAIRREVAVADPLAIASV
ncbi:hypothetical protein D3C81_1208520 [compost metagenome]